MNVPKNRTITIMSRRMTNGLTEPSFRIRVEGRYLETVLGPTGACGYLN